MGSLAGFSTRQGLVPGRLALPGAWEYGSPELLLAVLSSRPVPIQWAFAIRRLRLPPGSKEIILSGMPFDHARNSAAEMAVREGFRRLMFLDDDVLPPDDAYERLSSRGLDIVSGLYYRRQVPITPVALMDRDGRREWLSVFRFGDVVEVDYVGAGCLLIHRRVLERVARPWFEWLLDRADIPEPERTSEDFAFARKCRLAGFKVHMDMSVQCRHAGYGVSRVPGEFVPLEA